MRSKVFKTIWIVSLTVVIASLIFVVGLIYQYFAGLQKDQLKTEVKLAAQGVALSGEEYLKGVDKNDFRITWIDEDGRVLYDNTADSAKMENHLEREEVKQAIETGYGQSQRYSNTLANKELYAAKKLPDNTIVRVAYVQMALWAVIAGIAPAISFVIILALILSFVLASRLAKKAVEPINRIDLDHPRQYFGKEDYREIEPLLMRIARQQDKIREDQSRIERAAQIRQEFTANASHELKTPLHAISGYAELMENGMVKQEEIPLFSGKIRHEAGRMTKIIEDIIELSKLDREDVRTQAEDCDLLEISRHAVDSLQTAADEAGVAIEIQGEKTIVKGIPQLLYSIVYNLCDNAVKYNRPDGRVLVEVADTEKGAVLKVSDTGIGIREDQLDRIFERFYRVDKSRSKEAGGTGLGLSIVKHAAMIHEADVAVDSQPGEGTVFTVRFTRR